MNESWLNTVICLICLGRERFGVLVKPKIDSYCIGLHKFKTFIRLYLNFFVLMSFTKISIAVLQVCWHSAARACQSLAVCLCVYIYRSYGKTHWPTFKLGVCNYLSHWWFKWIFSTPSVYVNLFIFCLWKLMYASHEMVVSGIWPLSR